MLLLFKFEVDENDNQRKITSIKAVDLEKDVDVARWIS